MAILKGWQNSSSMGWQNSPGYVVVLKQAEYLHSINFFLCDNYPSNIIKEKYVVIKCINIIPQTFKFVKFRKKRVDQKITLRLDKICKLFLCTAH